MKPTGESVSLRQVLWLTLAVWAVIYLPYLGTLELKGEEGRRVFPALAMLETGNWLVPSVGGETYVRKPPLINWAIAAAVRVTGDINEWSVRIPSVLAMLALAVGMVVFLRRWLTGPGAFAAAVMVLTSIGLMEKGRLAEIEALFIACYGLAFSAWLAAVLEPAQRTRNWLLAGLFLGLGMMTKGPLPLLLFFYAFVFAHAASQRAWAELRGWRHWALVGLVTGPFAIWVAAQVMQLGADRVMEIWAGELAERANTGRFQWGRYAESVLRSLANFAPWVLLLPCLWRSSWLASMSGSERRLFVALRRALVFSWLIIALLPAARPRYTMPLMIPAAVLLMRLLVVAGAESGLRWPRRVLALLLGAMAALALVAALVLHASPIQWLVSVAVALLAGLTLMRLRHRADLLNTAFAAGLLAGLAWLLAGNLAFPRMLAQPNTERKQAAVLKTLVGDAPVVYAVRPGYERLLFHLAPRVRYATEWKALPAERPLYVLVIHDQDKTLLAADASAERLHALTTRQGNALELWRLARRH